MGLFQQLVLINPDLIEDKKMREKKDNLQKEKINRLFPKKK